MLQTELHPRLQQRELVEMARAANVGTIMAHCPLAHGSRALLLGWNDGKMVIGKGPAAELAQVLLL